MRATVAHFANTIIGKPGNIGVRTAQVLSRLEAHQLRGICVCRDSVVQISQVEFIKMGILGHIPRVMNAARIYVWPSFNHRPLDIALFEFFSTRRFADSSVNMNARCAHVWDTCPRLIRQLKARGLYVFLDVAIAPLAYGARLRRSGQAPFLIDSAALLETELEAFREADRLIAPSPFVAEELTSAGVERNRIEVIEFGVDIRDAGSPAASPLKRRRRRGLNYCFLGVVNRRKGVPELLRAWSTASFQNDRLHLCGRVFPEVRDHLAKASGGKIILPGFVNAHAYLLDCDVFVFPSWMEGSAKAVLDAMACGLPVIATTSAGTVVRDGIDGFVIAPGDVDTLREKMLWFKENPEAITEMGIRARDRAKEFTWGRYADRVIAQYGRVEPCD